MRKKFLTIFVCLISIFLFCGCAKINYSLTIESNGVVTQAVSLSFSETKVVNAGKTKNDVMVQISNVANQVVQNAYTEFLTSHTMDEDMQTYSGNTVKFADIVDFVNQNMEPNNGTAKIEWSRDGDTIYCTISLKFLNIYAYRYFNDSYPNSEKEDETVREDHFYYARDIDYSDSPFNDISNNSIAKYFMAYFNNQFSYDDIGCSFSYSTPNQKIYSNADVVEEDKNGNIVHTWNFTTEQITQDGKSQLALYTVKYRAYVWYITAIIITLIVGLILFAICETKEYQQKKYQSHFSDVDLENFKRTSQEIVEANKKDGDISES